MGAAPLGAWREVCSRCGRSWSLVDRRWLCTCGGLLDLVGPLVDPWQAGAARTGTGRLAPSGSPLLRYRATLPPGAAAVDLGMTITRVAELRLGMFVKADYQQPTGSFKDRGAAVTIGVAAGLGVDAVVVDSSGNAGKSAAAQEEVRRTGRWYASHVHQPLFHHGVKTLAFELFEQVPGLDSGSVVVPAGNGTLVLGLWIGFGELAALGRLRRRPVLVAVQAERCAPLAGLVPGSDAGAAPTAAAGIAIPAPPRAAQVRGAVLASGGRVVTVGEEAIASARDELAGLGFEVEPTGAVAWAGSNELGPREGPVVAVLTGR